MLRSRLVNQLGSDMMTQKQKKPMKEEKRLKEAVVFMHGQKKPLI